MAAPNTYANTNQHLTLLPVLEGGVFDNVFGNGGEVTGLKLRLAIDSPHGTVIKNMAGQAYFLKMMRELRDSMLRRYYLMQTLRARLIKQIKAYLKSHRTYTRGTDPELLKLPIDVESVLAELTAKMEGLQKTLADLFSAMSGLSLQIAELTTLMAQQEAALQVQLDVIANQTVENILTDFTLLDFYLDLAHLDLLHPGTPLISDFAHINLDQLVLAMQKQDPDLHHGHVVRLLHLVAYLQKHPNVAEELGITNLSDCTHEQLHQAINYAREHEIGQVFDNHWKQFDDNCIKCTKQHDVTCANNQDKLEQCNEQLNELNENVNDINETLDNYAKQYNQLTNTPFKMRPEPGNNKKTDENEIKKSHGI